MPIMKVLLLNTWERKRLKEHFKNLFRQKEKRSHFLRRCSRIFSLAKSITPFNLCCPSCNPKEQRCPKQNNSYFHFKSKCPRKTLPQCQLLAAPNLFKNNYYKTRMNLKEHSNILNKTVKQLMKKPSGS